MSRPTSQHIADAQADLALLKSREAALRAVGTHDLADVYKRAAREFQHPNFTGELNTLGVNHHAVRR